MEQKKKEEARQNIGKAVKKESKIPHTLQEVQQLGGEERMKYEIALELGLFDKVQAVGWKGLTARETGKVGGILAKRKKARQSPTKDSESKMR